MMVLMAGAQTGVCVPRIRSVYFTIRQAFVQTAELPESRSKKRPGAPDRDARGRCAFMLFLLFFDEVGELPAVEEVVRHAVELEPQRKRLAVGRSVAARRSAGQAGHGSQRALGKLQYLAGFLQRRYPPPLPLMPSMRRPSTRLFTIISRYFLEMPCLSAMSLRGT